MHEHEVDSLVDQLSDLPSLESVEVSLPQRPILSVIALAIVAGFLSLAGWAYWYACPHTPDLDRAMLIGAVFGVAGCIYILYRLFWTDFSWRTDAAGLMSRSLLRTRHTRWEDIQSAPRDTSSKPELLALAPLKASIWQHLRKCGRPGIVSLPREALSFWDTIPDAVPEDIEWDNPNHVRRTRLCLIFITTTLVLLAIVLMAFGWLTNYGASCSDFAVIALLYASFFGMFLACVRMQPDHIRLSGQEIEARIGSRSVVIKQGDVISANLDLHGMLHLRCRGRIHIIIPIDTIYDESSKLALAVIRWLRTAPKPLMVTIPDLLRSSYDSELVIPNDEDVAMEKVAIRMTLADKIASAFLAFMFSACIVIVIIGKSSTPSALTIITSAAIVFLISALTWWGVGSFVMTADRQGFTKRIFWWKKRVHWNEVADFTGGTRAGSGAQALVIHRFLKSKDGRVLANISPQCGSIGDWERFIQFVYARLKEALPPEKLNKPWKAKPWQDL